MFFIFYILIPILIGYFLGSIPTGFIIGKFKGIDLTKEGSGSIGATNTLRLLGKRAGITVLIIDFLKGFIAPILALKLCNLIPLAVNLGKLPMVIAALFCIIGHSKSIWIGFKGGKSAASGAGTIFALDWRLGLITFSIWFLTVYISKYSSLGALVAVFTCPFTMIALSFKDNDFQNSIWIVLYCFIAAIYIIWKHKENIKRLIKGEESKVKF